MRNVLALIAVAGAALTTLSNPASAASAAIYSTAEGAQSACPSEEVVWLNLNQTRYYHKSQASYGGTGGAYACVSAAHAKGYREAKESIQQATKTE